MGMRQKIWQCGEKLQHGISHGKKALNTAHWKVDTMDTTTRHDVLCHLLYIEGKGRRLLREKETQTSRKEVMHQMNSTGVCGKKAYEALATGEHATLKSIAEAHFWDSGHLFFSSFHDHHSCNLLSILLAERYPCSDMRVLFSCIQKKLPDKLGTFHQSFDNFSPILPTIHSPKPSPHHSSLTIHPISLTCSSVNNASPLSLLIKS